MKQSSNRRPRPRGNPNNARQRTGGRNAYDSNGPVGKVRGTAQQIFDKYQALGRDAATSGDRIAAESFFQFAEHYFRVVKANTANAVPDHNQGRHNEPESDRPKVIVDVPVVDTPVADAAAVDANIREDTDGAIDPAITEAVGGAVESSGSPAGPEEATPKTPRRRRARTKVEVVEI